MIDTVLVLSGLGHADYAMRGLAQTLELVGAGDLRRTVNGELIDVSLPLHRKFRSRISGGDVQPPAFDGVWKGRALTVDCIAEIGLRAEISAGSAAVALDRDPVPGSFRAMIGGRAVPVLEAEVDGREVALAFAPEISGAATIYYRPRLSMLVVDRSADCDEWAAAQDWSLDLEEV